MCAYIEHTSFSAAGLDAKFETAIVGFTPVREVAECEFAGHPEGAVPTDLVRRRV